MTDMLMSGRLPLGFLEELIRRGWEGGQGARFEQFERNPRVLAISDPMPWRTALAQLVEAAKARDLATRLSDARSGTFQKRADDAIDMVLDDYCGTPPRRIPWPWPGPPPWAFELASALSTLAYSVEAGGLRDTLLDIGQRALQKAGALG